jgi:hypothetical protein
METLTALNEWLFIVGTFICDFSGDIFLIQFLAWIHACMHGMSAKENFVSNRQPIQSFRIKLFHKTLLQIVSRPTTTEFNESVKKCNKLSKDAIYDLKTPKIVREREKERDVPFLCFWGLQIWDSEIVDVAKFVCEGEVIFLPFIQ